jgi:dTDP-4-dehydrorhamnose 3,5-epimerase
MEFVKTKLEGVILIKPEVFEDHRGEYVEIYNELIFKQKGIDVKFIQDDISVSSKGVLRGIHSDKEAWKLVTCLLGRYYLVIVNCDEQSKEFGKWESFSLSEKNRFMVLAPPNHGVAHIAISEKIIFHYKQSSNYNRSSQSTYRYDDPRFKIWWPEKKPVLSRRDEEGHYVD